MRETGAESMRQLPTLTLFKINMNLEMEKGTDALAAAVEAAPPRELERQPYDERDIAVIRALQGPMEVGRAALRRGRRRGRDARPTSFSSTCGAWSTARSCAASPRSSSTAAPASRPTAWASGRCPRTRSWRSAARMASVRGISHCYQRPTYEDWPYSVFTMAHGRSKEECDAILDSIAEDARSARRRPRHPLLLDRVQEDPPPLLHRRLRRAGRLSTRRAGRQELYRRALRGDARRGQLPGAGDAVRSAATRSSSSAARGCELVDVDGNRYVDWVCSWGPLILGHADPAVVAAVSEAAGRGTSYGAADRGRGRAGRGGRRALRARSRWCG